MIELRVIEPPKVPFGIFEALCEVVESSDPQLFTGRNIRVNFFVNGDSTFADDQLKRGALVRIRDWTPYTIATKGAQINER